MVLKIFQWLYLKNVCDEIHMSKNNELVNELSFSTRRDRIHLNEFGEREHMRLKPIIL